MARKQIGIVFAPAGKTDKLTASTTLKSLERILGSPRGGWNGPLLRALWPALHDRLDGRRLSVDLEEAWLIVTGFLLQHPYRQQAESAIADAGAKSFTRRAAQGRGPAPGMF
jgi:hypothetical protein